jgi:ABC-type polysaccharide/polyol phosphate export permease
MDSRADAPTMLRVDGNPMPRREWLAAMWSHREVISILSRSDFHVRYKRASLGVLWAVGIPLLQASVMGFVFSRLLRFETDFAYGPFVLAGVVAWSYFASALGLGSIAIVEGAGLTDKVWFPRGILPIVPCLSGLIGLSIASIILLPAIPLLGGELRPQVVIMVPAGVLLFLFTASLSLVLSALHVTYRDTRFVVGAALLVWFYVTPIIYAQDQLGRFSPWLDLNPLTGIINLFHLAVTPGADVSSRSILVSFVATACLAVIAVEQHRRQDRTFVDLL